jgi:hypothetical protein
VTIRRDGFRQRRAGAVVPVHRHGRTYRAVYATGKFAAMGLAAANEREVEHPIQLEGRATSAAWQHPTPRLRPDHRGVLAMNRGSAIRDHSPESHRHLRSG